MSLFGTISFTARTFGVNSFHRDMNPYPTRVPCRFKGKGRQVVLDQIRTVDRSRWIKKLGKIEGKTAAAVLDVLQEMFAR